jgi:hypothetical protein
LVSSRVYIELLTEVISKDLYASNSLEQQNMQIASSSPAVAQSSLKQRLSRPFVALQHLKRPEGSLKHLRVLVVDKPCLRILSRVLKMNVLVDEGIASNDFQPLFV